MNLQQFAPGGAVEASNGQGGNLTVSIQRGRAVAHAGVPITANGHRGSFGPETTVTFVRKEAECALNDTGFIDNMSTE